MLYRKLQLSSMSRLWTVRYIFAVLMFGLATGQETRKLLAATGEFSTPNYPRAYPNLNSEITWDLDLNPYESVTVSREEDDPGFRDQDEFDVKVDGKNLCRLGVPLDRITSRQWSFSAAEQPQKLSFVFKSRQRNRYFLVSSSRNRARQKVRYEVTCATGTVGGKPGLPLGCVYGTCAVDRSSSYAHPVKCSCPEGYYGSKCENFVYSTEFFHLNDARGIIQTPNFPNSYDLRKNLTWKVTLQPFEQMLFFQMTDHDPDLEKCCDSLALYTDKKQVASIDFTKQLLYIRQNGTPIVRAMAFSVPREIEVKFTSDGLITGKGYRMGYTISCGHVTYGNELTPWCLNGGTCSINRDATTAKPPSCYCAKNFEGSRCNETIQPTDITTTLTSPVGYFETPNYPQPYSHQTNITWNLQLQQFEFVNFESSEAVQPDFEKCCDSMKLFADGQEKFDFASPSGQPGTTLTTITADHGPRNIQIKFTSDGGVSGKGFRGRYSIGCINGRKEDEENACFNHGICSVTRKETSIAPVLCDCTGTGFTGYRCKTPVMYKSLRKEFLGLNGMLATPGYPQKYEKATNFTWIWELQPLEVFHLKKISEEPAGFETCCDTLTLTVNGSFHKEFNAEDVNGPHEMIVLHAGLGVTEITLQFLSDGGISGPGLEMEYKIECESPGREKYCLNGAICSVSRNESSVQPIQCFCAKDFEGQRCEKPLKRSIERIPLHSAQGVFETPGYPSHYPDGMTITWTIDLQRHEKVTFTNAGPEKPGFEDCCDFFHLIVDGKKVADFAEEGGMVGEVVATVEAKEVPKRVELRFHSDGGVNGVGYRGRYNIIYVQQEPSLNKVCLNGGRELLNRTEFFSGPVYCECTEDYTGYNCEKVAHVCPLNCGENSTCEWDSNKFVCQCDPGYAHTGRGCVDVDECLNNPCQKPWVCMNHPGSFSCKCPTESGFQEFTRKGKTVCSHSGCNPPWVYNTGKNGCLLLSKETMDDEASAKYCNSNFAELADVSEEQENHKIGLAATSPLVWFGLTDEQSEREWTWKGSKRRPVFTNWGPGFPSGQGHLAVLYPNRWTLGDCSVKKRFLCEAAEPYCPSEWTKLDQESAKCYYQSNYELDFTSAVSRCQMLAIGGKLVKWDAETALAFKPEFWGTDEGSGFAHFWVGFGECEAERKKSSCQVSHQMTGNELCEVEISLLTLIEPKTALLDVSATQKRNSILICPLGQKLKSCAYLYPNAWADYSGKGRDKYQLPTTACKRSTSAHFWPEGKIMDNSIDIEDRSNVLVVQNGDSVADIAARSDFLTEIASGAHSWTSSPLVTTSPTVTSNGNVEAEEGSGQDAGESNEMDYLSSQFVQLIHHEGFSISDSSGSGSGEMNEERE